MGDIDAGYGPMRVIGSEEVARIHEAIFGVDRDELRSRFDPADMVNREIYPDIWGRDPIEDDVFGYCAEYFEELKRFVGEAAAKGLGVVVWVR